MGTLFSYYDGSLEDFLIYIKEIQDNRLVKVRLGSVESFYHVLDNFAVKHIITKHSNEKEVLRGRLFLIQSNTRTVCTLTWRKSGKAAVNWLELLSTNEKGNSPTQRVLMTPLIPDLLPFLKNSPAQRVELRYFRICSYRKGKQLSPNTKFIF